MAKGEEDKNGCLLSLLEPFYPYIWIIRGEQGGFVIRLNFPAIGIFEIPITLNMD